MKAHAASLIIGALTVRAPRLFGCHTGEAKYKQCSGRVPVDP